MITRNNYEEYFLLYIDHELSVADRKAVEDFILQNPDLATELKMLQQSIIKPEQDIRFGNKALLYKNEEIGPIINLSNYEEYFLLYIDNELGPDAKKEIDKFINENPSMQKEFNLLQQTKLEPDNGIVFKHKETLYKKEERKRPIYITWMSAAAVAILLVTGFLFYNNTKPDINHYNQVVKTRNNEDKNTQPAKNINKGLAVTPATVDTFNNKEQLKKESIALNNVKDKNKASTKNKIEKLKKELDNTNNNLVVTKPKKDNQMKGVGPVDINKSTKGDAKNKELITINQPLVDTAKQTVAVNKHVDNNSPHTENHFARQLAMNDNKVEYIDVNNNNTKKNKLRGIFRKVSRVFEKTTNADDDNKHSLAIGNIHLPL